MWDLLKGFFGISTFQGHVHPSGQCESEVEISQRNGDDSSVEIFTNPFEIHRYVEKEMNNLFKTVFDERLNFFGSLPTDINSLDVTDSGTLRDTVLKPGFNDQQFDSDLDDHVNTDDFKKYFGSSPPPNIGKSNATFTFESVRTVRHPNGEVETIRKVRDANGREETTVTHEKPSGSSTFVPSISPFPFGDTSFQGEDFFRKLF